MSGRFSDSPHDPFGYAADLDDALHSPHLDIFGSGEIVDNPSEASAQAACDLAIALGFCALYGVQAPHSEDILPVNVAIVTANALTAQVAEWINTNRDFPRQMDECGPDENLELCGDVLDLRMTLWAALVALEIAYDDAAESKDVRLPQFRQAHREVLDKVAELDDLLVEPDIVTLLSCICLTRQLENWRQLLVAPWNDPLPWWLDGLLEEIAELPTLTDSTPQAFQAESPGSVTSRGNWFYRVTLAAAESNASIEPMTRWNSPAGDGFAILIKAAPEDPTVSVDFYDLDSNPLQKCIGQTVQLETLSSTVDADGAARFKTSDLIELARLNPDSPPSLRVGKEQWSVVH